MNNPVPPAGDPDPQVPAHHAASSVEQWLVRACQDIFGVAMIDAQSDFFDDLGGTSMTAIKLLSRIEATYGADVLLPDALFENGRLPHLAAAIAAALQERPRR